MHLYVSGSICECRVACVVRSLHKLSYTSVSEESQSHERVHRCNWFENISLSHGSTRLWLLSRIALCDSVRWFSV